MHMLMYPARLWSKCFSESSSTYILCVASREGSGIACAFGAGSPEPALLDNVMSTKI